MKTKLLLMLLMMVALSVSAAADPTSITVPNFGFETPVRPTVGGYGGMGSGDSWGYFTTDGYGGTWHVELADFSDGAPEPNNVGYCDVYAGSPGPHGIAQVLAETFEPNQVYTLTVEVGDNGWYEFGAGYLVQLVVGGTQAGGGGALVTGGTVIAQDDDTVRLQAHKFATSTVTYFPSGHDSLKGQPLQIRLLGKVPNSGLNEPCWDLVRLQKQDAGALPVRAPYPSYAQELIPTTDVTLSWLNADSTDDPPGPVYVKVWWGTDPENLDVILPLSGKPVEADNVYVGVNSEATYYWQVESWTQGTMNGPSDQMGAMWWYDIVDQLPSVEINTPDMNTWLGQPVSLSASVVDDGGSAISYLWTADPSGVFDDATALDTNVTITGLLGDPSTVTLTFAATDGKGTATDTMTIDVYSDACAATRLAWALQLDTDITGDTCKADIEDLALAVATWLDDIALTTPIAKP